MNGELKSNLEFIALSDSSMYLIQLLFVAKKKTNGHQIAVGFQSIAALAQAHLSSQYFQHTTGRQKNVTARLFVCVCMCDTCLCVSACGGEQLGLCIIAFDVRVE